MPFGAVHAIWKCRRFIIMHCHDHNQSVIVVPAQHSQHALTWTKCIVIYAPCGGITFNLHIFLSTFFPHRIRFCYLHTKWMTQIHYDRPSQFVCKNLQTTLDRCNDSILLVVCLRNAVANILQSLGLVYLTTTMSTCRALGVCLHITIHTNNIFVLVAGAFGYDKNLGTCSILKDSNGRSSKTALFVIAFVIPCIIIIGCYARIFWVVHE